MELVGEEVVRVTTGKVVEVPKTRSQSVTVCSYYHTPYPRVKFALARGWLPPQVDHIDRDRGNNSLSNLRAATPQQNQRNKGPMPRKDTGLRRGVFLVHTKDGTPRFKTQVWLNGRYHYPGVRDTEEEASALVEGILKELHGDRYCPRPPTTAKGGE